jgi:hypothetical protein
VLSLAKRLEAGTVWLDAQLQSYRSLARRTPAGRTSCFLHRRRPVFPLQPPQNPIDNHSDLLMAAVESTPCSLQPGQAHVPRSVHRPRSTSGGAPPDLATDAQSSPRGKVRVAAVPGDLGSEGTADRVHPSAGRDSVGLRWFRMRRGLCLRCMLRLHGGRLEREDGPTFRYGKRDHGNPR